MLRIRGSCGLSRANQERIGELGDIRTSIDFAHCGEVSAQPHASQMIFKAVGLGRTQSQSSSTRNSFVMVGGGRGLRREGSSGVLDVASLAELCACSKSIALKYFSEIELLGVYSLVNPKALSCRRSETMF